MFAEQPIREEARLTGPLEPTNEWYAIAKITGSKLCERCAGSTALMPSACRRSLLRRRSLLEEKQLPSNLYGPGDNYHPTNSHVLPALIRRFHEAAERGDASVTCWGSGNPPAGVPACG